MIKEYGVVTQADKSSAWVKTTRTSACEGCSSRESCGGHGGKEMTVVVKNTLSVEQGDQVVIGIQTGPMILLAFLLYVFPVIFLVAGALIGDFFAPFFSVNSSLGALITGGVGFALAFALIRKNHSKLNKKDEYKPFLIKKISSIGLPCQTP